MKKPNKHGYAQIATIAISITLSGILITGTFDLSSPEPIEVSVAEPDTLAQPMPIAPQQALNDFEMFMEDNLQSAPAYRNEQETEAPASGNSIVEIIEALEGLVLALTPLLAPLILYVTQRKKGLSLTE